MGFDHAAWARDNYAKNSTRINAWRKAHRDANPEVRERHAKAMREHRAENVESHRERDMARKRASLYWRAKIRCVRCGYEACPAALQWHHTDPSTKEANPSELIRKSEQVQYNELMKCVLVCANCHFEAGAGLWEVTDDHRRQSEAFIHSARGVDRDDDLGTP